MPAHPPQNVEVPALRVCRHRKDRRGRMGDGLICAISSNLNISKLRRSGCPSFPQKVAGATKGVSYNWTFTEYYFPSDGTGGGCSTQRVSWTWPLSVSQLNYKLASQSGDYCYHNLSCTPPISNACTNEFPTKTTQAPPPDDNGGYCFPYQFYYALIVKKTSGSECLIGVGTDSPVAQQCY
jgi:hypothetical protein